MTTNVAEDFVRHIHIYQAPSGRIFVQDEQPDGTNPDPKQAITLCVWAAQYLAAAHGIPLTEEG